MKLFVMSRENPKNKLHVMTMSARVTECPTKYVLEARYEFKAPSALFNAAIVASSAFTRNNETKTPYQDAKFGHVVSIVIIYMYVCIMKNCDEKVSIIITTKTETHRRKVWSTSNPWYKPIPEVGIDLQGSKVDPLLDMTLWITNKISTSQNKLPHIKSLKLEL